MKNKLRQLRERLSESAFYQKAPRPVRWIIGSLSNNLGLKLLSLLLAILLWNYVITTNTSITRAKTLYNLTGYINGQTVLNDNKLALTEDPAAALSGISVVIEAPQKDYSKVSADNVQVTLDLSNVRNAGTQQVPLRATSSYGRVRSITPDTLTLTFETLDSRNVAVNSAVSGGTGRYWYNVTRTNPSILTVSGAASVVQSIASARVDVDVSGMTASTVTALPYVLLDASGTEISQAMLNCSTSSISASVEVYPSREIPITADSGNLVTGAPAEGYVLQSVTVQPDKVQVAAEKDLLDGLTELMIEPVSIDGASQSFSAKATVSQLSNFKNVSSEEVYVNVTIAEETLSAEIEKQKVVFTGKADNLVATYEPFNLVATGPRSVVEDLVESGVTVGVDLTGLGEGSQLLSPVVDPERYPDVSFECEAIYVTLTDISPEEPEASAVAGAETPAPTEDD